MSPTCRCLSYISFNFPCSMSLVTHSLLEEIWLVLKLYVLLLLWICCYVLCYICIWWIVADNTKFYSSSLGLMRCNLWITTFSIRIIVHGKNCYCYAIFRTACRLSKWFFSKQLPIYEILFNNSNILSLAGVLHLLR